MDNNINATREIVEHLIVTDSTHNGFRVVYSTVDNVTSERLEEIRSRPHIKEGFNKLQKDAPVHFGSLLKTDIYDFADFAIDYVPDPAIEMHNIFVHGGGKAEMYSLFNPDIPNCARWINFSTEQGMQYINRDDIYYRRNVNQRIYRYWKCYGLRATSKKDERFSHFSEDERVW